METSQLIAVAGVIVTALWGSTIALAKIVWTEKTQQIQKCDTKVAELETENRELQQASIDLLKSYQARDAEDLKAYRRGRKVE